MARTLFSDLDDSSWTFDAVPTEEWSDPAKVATHPVDRKTSAANHRQQLPEKLTLTCWVTDLPMEGGFVTIAFGRPSSLDAYDEGRFPVSKFREWLRAHKADTFSYDSTRYGVVEGLVLENANHTIDNNRRAIWSLEFTVLQFARSELVEVPREFRKAKPIKQCQIQKADEVGKGDDPEQKVIDESYLRELIGPLFE